MKKWIKPVSYLIIAGTLFVGGTFLTETMSPVQPAYADSDVQRNTLSVVGSGEISVKPDIAYVSIGVVTEASTAKEAQSANAEKINIVTKLLKGTWGISDKDIETDQFNVQPDYTYSDKDGQKIKGYSAQHTVTVTYRDLTKVGQLLDAASDAGANRINNVRFGVENPDQYQEQVIQKAMADANKKAAAIAKAANRQVGSALSISQSGGDMPIFAQSQALKMADSGSASTSIEPGEIDVQTTLSVMYELK